MKNGEAKNLLASFPDLARLSAEDKETLIKELRKTCIPKRTFILGLDLDGVVMDFYGGLKKIAAHWLNKKPEELPDDFTFGLKEWGLLEKSGG